MLLDEVCRQARILAPDAEVHLSHRGFQARVLSRSLKLDLCGVGSTRAESIRMLGWAVLRELRARGLHSNTLWAALEEVAA